MIGLIATLVVAPEDAAAFEARFAEMTAKVKAHEPETSLYQLCRVRKREGAYKALELYATDDARKAHVASDHFRELWPALRGMLIEEPTVEIVEAV